MLSEISHVQALRRALIGNLGEWGDQAVVAAVDEVAASGLPILATPVNGIRELVDDGENGFLIEADAHDISERLGQLGDDRELRLRLGAASREAALDYSWSKMVERHDALYQSFVSD